MKVEEFSNWLRNEMIHGQEIQFTVAEGIGVSQGTVGKYVRGEVIPNWETMSRIADYFGCRLEINFKRDDDV